MTISAAFLDELRARMPVSAVVGRRVKLQRAGREWVGLSPFSRERTASFTVNDAKGFYHDFSSGKHGDVIDFLMETEGLNFHQAVERIADLAGMTVPDGEQPQAQQHVAPVPPGRDDDEQARQDRTRRLALNIWNTAGDLGGTLAAQYLAGRKLALPEGVSGRALRFNPRCPWRNEADELVAVPALIGLFRGIHDDEPKAILRRALTADGRKLGKPRALGAVSGCAIKLTANEDVEQGLHIGEGVETVLAAMMLGFQPAWALGGTAGIARFPIQAGIDALTILVDVDDNGAGQRAATECCERWTEAGREVVCAVPANGVADMNDIVMDGST